MKHNKKASMRKDFPQQGILRMYSGNRKGIITNVNY